MKNKNKKKHKKNAEIIEWAVKIVQKRKCMNV